MTTPIAEPHELLARLERKYVRKVQAAESRRRMRDLRTSLSRMDGVQIRQMGEEVIDVRRYQEF